MTDNPTNAAVLPKPASAREKIAKLRATFIEQLPGRLQELRVLFERLTRSPTDRTTAIELHRALHSLKGTGSSFGFRELGTAAGLGEDLAAILIENANPTEHNQWQETLCGYIHALDRIVTGLCAPADSTGNHHEPGFDLSVLSHDANANRASGGRVVYLCDDEEMVLEQLASQLNCFGYETVTFTDPQALRQAVLARQPDAVVLDIHFPHSSQAGTDMLVMINREITQPVPAIFLSSRNDFEARLAAVQAGGEAYFTKPAQSGGRVW